jgi:hypothetical protein
MIGSKGNAALVTFSDTSSCSEAVDFYADSNEMRTTFVGTRKFQKPEYDQQRSSSVHSLSHERDQENIHDCKLRREMEREQLLRQME